MSFEKIFNYFKNGGCCIVADDENRENEIDIICSAEHCTENNIINMLKYGSGIICTPMNKESAIKCNLTQMVTSNTDPLKTNFTISVDSKYAKTGVSAKERLMTIKTLVDIIKDKLSSDNLQYPGHIFPLVSHDKGLSERQGHTEAAVVLCNLSDCLPIGVIVECQDHKTGEMIRLKDLTFDCNLVQDCFGDFIKQYNCTSLDECPIFTIERLKKFISYSSIIKLNDSKKFDQANSPLSIKINNKVVTGEIICFKDHYTTREYSMWVYPSLSTFKQSIDNSIIRMHSECCTGNIFHSQHCDCEDQFNIAMQMIIDHGCGAIMYITNHEGRGIGLFNKIKAYNLQYFDNVDTFKANNLLGFKDDQRNYFDCVQILKELDCNILNLITNNPIKLNNFNPYFKTVNMINIKISKTKFNHSYIQSKMENGHLQITKKKLYLDTIDFISQNEINICIVKSSWNKPYVTELESLCIKELQKYNFVNTTIIEVPGSWEIPCKVASLKNKFDCFIVLGVLIKGETMHFEHISTSVFNGLMNCQITPNINNRIVPIINGILTVLDESQIENRIELATGWAKSAIQMCL